MVQNISLTREQQQLARNFGNWQIGMLIAYPDRLREAPGWPWIGGSSHRQGLPFMAEHYWFAYDAKGIRVLTKIGGDVVAEVKWQQLKRWAFALPGWIPEKARVVLRERAEHRGTYKPFAASKKAIGCGPIPKDPADRTEAQALYVEEHDRWMIHVREYEAGMETIDQRLDYLISEAFPGADNLCRCSLSITAHLFSADRCGTYVGGFRDAA